MPSPTMPTPPPPPVRGKDLRPGWWPHTSGTRIAAWKRGPTLPPQSTLGWFLGRAPARNVARSRGCERNDSQVAFLVLSSRVCTADGALAAVPTPGNALALYLKDVAMSLTHVVTLSACSRDLLIPFTQGLHPLHVHTSRQTFGQTERQASRQAGSHRQVPAMMQHMHIKATGAGRHRTGTPNAGQEQIFLTQV
eukprot:366414-Chlamydomonas_euryale.AAC.1